MPTRLQLLAVRVRWLDRYRRLLSLLAACIVSPLLVARLDATLGSEWPVEAAVLFGVVLGVLAWWAAEVVFAALVALWETEYWTLMRERGLPRAIVLRK